MPNVILSGYIIVPPDDLTEVQRELPNHIEKTLEEEGCLIFSVTQDAENKFKFNVHEEFTDQDTFAAHQERVRASTWGIASKNIERHYHTKNAV